MCRHVEQCERCGVEVPEVNEALRRATGQVLCDACGEAATSADRLGGEGNP